MENILNKKNVNKNQRAYLIVKQYIKNNKDKLDSLKKFRTCTIKLPTMIKVNGLIMTLAFIKGKSEYQCIYDEICQYYCDLFTESHDIDIIETLMRPTNSDVYREHIDLVTTELIGYLLIIKKFAVSEINMIISD